MYAVLDEELKTNVGGGDESRWNDKEHVSADDLTKKKTMPYPGFDGTIVLYLILSYLDIPFRLDLPLG